MNRSFYEIDELKQFQMLTDFFIRMAIGLRDSGLPSIEAQITSDGTTVEDWWASFCCDHGEVPTRPPYEVIMIAPPAGDGRRRRGMN